MTYLQKLCFSTQRLRYLIVDRRERPQGNHVRAGGRGLLISLRKSQSRSQPTGYNLGRTVKVKAHQFLDFLSSESRRSSHNREPQRQFLTTRVFIAGRAAIRAICGGSGCRFIHLFPDASQRIVYQIRHQIDRATTPTEPILFPILFGTLRVSRKQ